MAGKTKQRSQRHFDRRSEYLPLTGGKQGNFLPQRPAGIGFVHDILPLAILNPVEFYFLII